MPNKTAQVTLEHAQRRHVELAAMELVDLASLQEQRNEGAEMKVRCSANLLLSLNTQPAEILQILGGLVLGCIKTKSCKKICV